jgi:TorA maturation chaperone TorD
LAAGWLITARVRLSADEVKKATVTRGTLYRLLSRAFSSEVDEKFVERLLKLQPVVSGLAKDSESEDFGEGSRLLGKFIGRVKSDYGRDKHAFLQELAAEYASLFLNVGLKPVHLAESVYLGKSHLLYEEPYFDVVRIYGLYGFKKKTAFREPEDHISVELEFMAHLCDLVASSIEQEKKDYAAGYLKNQKEFLEMHLAKWVPELVKKVKWASENDFYLAMAALLQGFVTIERSFAPRLAKEL